MCTLHCDIIKDLIPSYVDEISSEETKKAVEAHLSQCQECRAYLDAVKSTEISAGEAGQGPLNQPIHSIFQKKYAPRPKGCDLKGQKQI